MSNTDFMITFTINVYANGIEKSYKIGKKPMESNLFSRDEIKNIHKAFNAKIFHAKIKKGIIYRNRMENINFDNSNNDLLGVFVGDECRGIAERIYFPYNDKYIYISLIKYGSIQTIDR